MAETTLTASSSNISQYTYEPDEENLTIEFRSGDSYIYYNVPASVHRGLQSAGSVGEYHARHIKGRFNYEKL